MLQRATIKPTKQGKNLEPPKHEQRPYKIKRKKAGEADTILNNWRFQKDRLLHLKTAYYIWTRFLTTGDSYYGRCSAIMRQASFMENFAIRP